MKAAAKKRKLALRKRSSPPEEMLPEVIPLGPCCLSRYTPIILPGLLKLKRFALPIDQLIPHTAAVKFSFQTQIAA
jgi:hypothetical protein